MCWIATRPRSSRTSNSTASRPRSHTRSTASTTDPDTLVIDGDATDRTRARLRQDRLTRGRPYSEFVKEFVKPEPPKDLLYYGSWGDETDKLTATYFTVNGPQRIEATVADMPIIMMPDARDLKVAALEERVRELEDKHGEKVTRKS